MSLVVNNRLTEKQKEMLQHLGYYGNLNLSAQDAEIVIDNLIEEQAEANRDPIYDDPLQRYKVIPVILIKEKL